MKYWTCWLENKKSVSTKNKLFQSFKLWKSLKSEICKISNKFFQSLFGDSNPRPIHYE